MGCPTQRRKTYTTFPAYKLQMQLRRLTPRFGESVPAYIEPCTPDHLVVMRFLPTALAICCSNVVKYLNYTMYYSLTSPSSTNTPGFLLQVSVGVVSGVMCKVVCVQRCYNVCATFPWNYLHLSMRISICARALLAASCVVHVHSFAWYAARL